MSSELEHVTKERDKLAAQLKQDAESWSERLEAATVKCKILVPFSYTLYL